ncbi:MAG TPA: AAA family ATPase [Candidatus Kapabacteria bacterium]|nr:AAA family ATPase [Candidatus Kapabacteria bacterium]
MPEVPFESLEVNNFRGFSHLVVEQLGRVNLIVGKNSVGKSSLLEALWLYAQRGSLRTIEELLISRDELSSSRVRSELDWEKIETAIRSLLHGRADIRRGGAAIRIGPLDTPDRLLALNIGWYRRRKEEDGAVGVAVQSSPSSELPPDAFIGCAVQFGEERGVIRGFERLGGRTFASRVTDDQVMPSFFMPANGLSQGQIGLLWDEIALTDLEEDVVRSLQIVVPEIERINLISMYDDFSERVGRIPVIRMRGEKLPIPLRELGEGTSRMLGLTLCLVNTQGGLLLIDEIDSGLHYSTQYRLWELIFEVARRLNIQVFATTHSWDCIESFQAAASVNENDGMLIRLSRKGEGAIASTTFDGRRLKIATREHIEIR